MEEPQLNMEVLAKLENRVDDLKKAYEKYFAGIEPRSPERDLVRLQGEIRKLRNVYTSNFGIRFRLESLVSKFLSFSRYWARIMREIEEGRYTRDRFKADLRVGKLDKSKPVSAITSPEEKKLDENIDSLYKEYMMARIECNQGTEGLSKEKIKESIKKTIPALQKKYQGKEIQFKVVVEGGKAKLKAIPK